ncbi:MULTISPECIES: hypothetical protein [unclassified Cupriavidus]|uniref:hypothetical protein n=1 Tax=unclassified Cupriavidus TaxID=2640874 RepID=UPI0008832289|nr:hypothetical protein [Cupriavidus sp. YR651]SDD73141.1 hypothetical protein SAMN05216345_11493 [Cupriavidus sp. YR651]
MPTASIESARTFLLDVKLPPVDPDTSPMLLDAEAPAFEADKDQAVVVGSGVLTFAKGVPPERRSAVANSLLLAQLVARRVVGDPSNVDAWYKEYVSVLANIGWLVETSTATKYVEGTQNFETHKAIMSVAALLLGPGAPGALALVNTTLDALASMDDTKPWITIFSRETRAANVSSFQVALAEQSPDGHFVVSMMAFALKAGSAVTQVLFFKAKKNDVELTHYDSKAEINLAVLDALEPELSNRVAQHSKSFISQLPDL